MLVHKPEYRGNNVIEIIMNFFEDLGRKKGAYVQPTKVIMNEKDWQDMFEFALSKHPNDDRVSVCFWFINKSPSGDKDVPEGKVRLEDGWQWEEESVEEEQKGDENDGKR